MRYLRCIYGRHWDVRRKQFNHLAFKSLDGGVSVVDSTCVSTASPSICEHLKKWYSLTHHSGPIMFWEFESDEILPKHAVFNKTLSGKGDNCHCDISNLHRNEEKKISYSIQLDSVRACDNGNMRSATINDFSDAPSKE
jgi:hypothetical protein